MWKQQQPSGEEYKISPGQVEDALTGEALGEGQGLFQPASRWPLRRLRGRGARGSRGCARGSRGCVRPSRSFPARLRHRGRAGAAAGPPGGGSAGSGAPGLWAVLVSGGFFGVLFSASPTC